MPRPQTCSLASRSLEQLISGEEIRQEAADRIATEMQAVAGRLDAMSTAERRDLLRRLQFRVTVTPDGSKARVEFAGVPFLASEGLLPASSHRPNAEVVMLAPIAGNSR